MAACLGAAITGLYFTAVKMPKEGVMAHSVTLPKNSIKCKQDSPYYIQLHSDTNLKNKSQQLMISYQCHENNGARVYLDLGHYSIDQKTPCKQIAGASHLGVQVKNSGNGCSYPSEWTATYRELAKSKEQLACIKKEMQGKNSQSELDKANKKCFNGKK